MNNVVAFPKGKRGSPPQTIEESMKLVEESRIAHIENVLDNMIPHFVNVINDEGFDVTKEHMALPLSYFVEVVRGILYVGSGLDHPIVQEAAVHFREDVEEA